MLISAIFKLHNISLANNIPCNEARLRGDTRPDSSALPCGGGDKRGQEWPEWTLPDSAWGDDRPNVRPSRHTCSTQPLRETLTAKLATAGRIRPETARFSYVHDP